MSKCPIHGNARAESRLELTEEEARELVRILEKEERAKISTTRKQEEDRERQRIASMSERELAMICNDGVHSTVLCSDRGCDRDPCSCGCHDIPVPPDPFRHLRRSAHTNIKCAFDRNCKGCDCKCHQFGTTRTAAKPEEIDGIPVPPDPFAHLRKK